MNRMNDLWMKWITLSVSDYIAKFFVNDYVWMQDMVRPNQMPSDRYEVRYTGPDFTIVSRDSFDCELTLNCQIVTGQITNEMESHLLRIGNAQKMLAVCIPVYKFGTNPVTDTKLQLSTLQLTSGIMTTPFGSIDPVSRLVRSTVEASYKMTIEV